PTVGSMRPRSRHRPVARSARLRLSRSLIQLAASLLETHGPVRSQKPPRTTVQPLPGPARSQKQPRTTVQPLPSQKRPPNRFGNALACLVAAVSSGVSSATVTSCTPGDHPGILQLVLCDLLCAVQIGGLER